MHLDERNNLFIISRIVLIMSSEATMKCTRKRKLVLADIMSGKCLLCGFDKYPERLRVIVIPSGKRYKCKTYILCQICEIRVRFPGPPPHTRPWCQW